MNVVSYNTNCCARKINVAFDAISKCLGSNDSFTPAFDLGDFITLREVFYVARMYRTITSGFSSLTVKRCVTSRVTMQLSWRLRKINWNIRQFCVIINNRNIDGATWKCSTIVFPFMFHFYIFIPQSKYPRKLVILVLLCKKIFQK